MKQSQPARGYLSTRRSASLASLVGVTLTSLLCVVACNDGDALDTPTHSSGGSAGASAVVGDAGEGNMSGAATAGSSAAGQGEGGQGEGGQADAGQADAGQSGRGDAGAAGEDERAPHCTASTKAPFVVGNYADAAGNELFLRAAAKATTLALVPAGAATPSKPPRLFLVNRVCAPGGALIVSDASSSYRVDFTQGGSQLTMCMSAPVASLDAAVALPAADASRTNTGCAGKAFTVYTAEAL